mmetsp:Transcript_51614/g.95546  ORF Transcript_51614/g.95546 Transcript_51614/m.95546 type:complete len:139 (+) Transcript_51614:100-516(+)
MQDLRAIAEEQEIPPMSFDAETLDHPTSFESDDDGSPLPMTRINADGHLSLSRSCSELSEASDDDDSPLQMTRVNADGHLFESRLTSLSTRVMVWAAHGQNGIGGDDSGASTTVSEGGPSPTSESSTDVASSSRPTAA